MNLFFKLVFFSIMLNFATGLMIDLIPYLGNNPQYNPYLDAYNVDNQEFVTGMNGTISPTPDQSNTFFRLIDSLNIGLIQKFLNTINNYMYGFLNFINALFKIQDMTVAQDGINGAGIMATLKGALTVAYIAGAFWLWTGKNVTQ